MNQPPETNAPLETRLHHERAGEPYDAPNRPTARGWRRLYVWLIGGAGLFGGISCTASMTLAAIGLVGSTAVQASHSQGGMAGMNATSGPAVRSSNRVQAFLIAHGPIILIVSALLVVFSLGLRRRWFAAPALAIGALMYWGMYEQSNVTMMYVASGIGILFWLLLFVLLRNRGRIRQLDPTG